MSEEGKVVKFKFVVDEQSAQRVNRVLDEMIKRAQELAKTLQGVGGFGGGMLGGGTVGGRAPSAQSTFATASAPQTQKISFSSVLTQNVDAFKKMAQEGGSAMKVLGDAVNRGVSQQQREIFKLQQSMEALLRTYDKLGGVKSGRIGEGIQDRVLSLQTRIAGHQKELSKLEGMRPPGSELMPEIPWPDQAQKAGWLSRFRGFLNQGGGIGGQPLSAASLGKIPGLGFLGGGMGGMILGGTTALAGLGVKMGIQAITGAWNAPLIAAAARAESASDIGSYSRKLRSGNYSDIRAMTEIENDATKKAEYETIQNPGWFRRQANRIGAAWDAQMERGAGFEELFQGTEGYNYQKNLRKALRAKIDSTIEERGILEDIDADATSNAVGKMDTMRALGIGDGRKKTGDYRSNSERFLNAFNQFDPSRVIAAVQEIAGSGTRSAAYANKFGLLSSVLQAQAAGISGAGQVGGVFSRSGRGQTMVDLLRSIAGAGTDVSTAGLLGQTLAAHADQYGASFSGSGMLGALAYGTQGPGGAMVARQNIGGFAQQQALYSGTRDAAQKAQNFLYARQTAPNAGYYAQQYLATKLDAGRVNDILAGDVELTGEERSLGITPSMLRMQAWRIRNSLNFRTMTKGFAQGSDPYKMMQALQSGESLRGYVNKTFAEDRTHREFEGLTEAEEQRAIETYATTLRAGNESLSWKDALGQARQDLFGQGRRARKGRMVGDVAGGSLESKIAKEEAEKRKTDLDLKDASMDRLEKETEGVGKAYRRLVTNSENLAITANNIADIIKNFSANLKAAAGGAPSINAKSKPKD